MKNTEYLGAERNFLGLDESWSDPHGARVVILPVPYEHTSSYGRGSKNGPEAILRASHQVELYDEELRCEVFRETGGIATISPSWFDQYLVDGNAVAAIRDMTGSLLENEKFVVTLGGEHTISVGAVRAFSDAFDRLSILQLDAHADLRDSYDGNRYSHASTMRRIFESNRSIVQYGVRSMSREEAAFIEENGIECFRMHSLRERENHLDTVIDALDFHVYLSIDLDVFAPCVLPGTGAPEPGGLCWYWVTDLIEEVARYRRIVGFDVVELSPIPGNPVSEFSAAKLIYKTLGYIFSQD